MASYTTYYERTLEDTATWAVAVVCFVLLAISLLVEHFLHLFEKVELHIHICIEIKIIYMMNCI